MSRSRERLALLAAVVTNALPIAGVTLLGWSIAALVLVYWVEFGVALSFAAVRALFAQRPPEYSRDLLVVSATEYKRGELSMPGTDVGIQAASVPVVAVVVPVFGLIWLLSGAVAIGGLEAAIGGELLDDRATITVGLGMLGVVIGRAIETISNYFLATKYEAVNAQLALRSAIWPILVVGFALVVAGNGVAAGAPTGSLLVALVGTKFLFDLVGVYRERLQAFDERTDVSFGWAQDPPTWTPVDERLEEPIETVRPHPGAVLVAGTVRGVRTDGVVVPILVGLIGAGLAALGSDAALLLFAGGIAGSVLLLLVILGIADQGIRHLPMEYRIGDAIVGYDRLLHEAQWRIPAWKVDRCEPRRTLPDRLFGTETFVVRHDGRTIRIPHVLADVAERHDT